MLNNKNEYVDSFVFTQQENLPTAQAKNGWVPFGSGNLASDEEFLKEYSKDGNLGKYIQGLGLKDTSNLKLISSIAHLPPCLYFVQENEEFLIPFQEGLAEMRAFQVYKAGDVVEQVLNPILDYWSDVKEKYKDSEEIIVGVPLVPSDLPAITPVNLQTYFKVNDISDPIQQNVESIQTEKNEILWVPVVVVVGIIFCLVGVVFFIKKKKG